MMTADVTRANGPPRNERTPPTAAVAPPSSPTLSFGWLLRAAAGSAAAAGIMGVIVAPGVRGNASEALVVAAERMSASLSCFLYVLLVPLVMLGGVALLRTRQTAIAPRVALIGGGAAVIVMSLPGVREGVPPSLAVLIASAAVVACLAGAYCAARTPHTRAVAGILVVLAFASMTRLGAWELATRAGDTANMQTFALSRNLATAAVLFEATGQLLAVTWLGTRGRWSGQLASLAALGAAYVLTWGVARGVHSGAAPWQAVLHTALADAPGVPPPYGLDALATFLVPASLLLALVAAALPQQVVAIVAAIALALVSRGAFDAPLRALCAVAAAQWAALAAVDGRAMWAALIEDRNRRLKAEAPLGAGAPNDKPGSENTASEGPFGAGAPNDKPGSEDAEASDSPPRT